MNCHCSPATNFLTLGKPLQAKWDGSAGCVWSAGWRLSTSGLQDRLGLVHKLRPFIWGFVAQCLTPSSSCVLCLDPFLPLAPGLWPGLEYGHRYQYRLGT